MPKCDPRCPLVKEQLRKIAIEAPWLLKELTTNGDRKAASLLQTVDGKIVAKSLDGKERKSSTDTHDRHYDRRSKGSGTQTPTKRTSKEEKEAKIRAAMDPTDKSALERQRTSATQWSDDKKEFVEPVYTMDSKNGTDEIDKADRIDTANGTSKTDMVRKVDKETISQETDGLDGTGEIDKEKKTDKELSEQKFIDECDPSCPRRISRKSRIRKLEETQRIVDAYLLNKGSRYFDDVCTCSLSCVLRSIIHDSFVTSTLASVVLFSLGVKLCSELNAWYLPIRFS